MGVCSGADWVSRAERVRIRRVAMSGVLGAQMPLCGGASAKYGDRYEGKWTVYCLARVMEEDACEIRLEDPGAEGEGCEFWLKRRDGATEYHQVKRQHAAPRAWTMADLRNAGVLDSAYEKTRGGNSRYIFISTERTAALTELGDAARHAESLPEFLNLFLSSDVKKGGWQMLLREWRLGICGELALDPNAASSDEQVARAAYERLRRIFCRVSDEVSLEELVDRSLQLLVRGVPPETLRAELAAHALEHVHDRLDTEALWAWVEGKGYGRTDYAEDSTVLAAIESQNKRCAGMVDPIAGKIVLAREEARQAFNILTGEGASQSVLISGGAGIGKSGILAQTIGLLRDAKIPYLCLRVDRLTPVTLADAVGEQLGLPGSPAAVLANAAKYRRSVLVVDQLDDVSLASGRNPEFFECIDEIIRQAVSFPGVHLLLACRRFDLQKDYRLRRLVGVAGPAIEIEASLFGVDEVRSVLEQLGQDADLLGSDEIELLRVPLHLSMYAEVLSASAKRAPAVRSRAALLEAFWEEKLRRVDARLGGKTCQWIDVLDRLCTRMAGERSLFVDETVLDEFHSTYAAMLTERVLVSEKGHVCFFHAAFFDYVFARRFVSKSSDLLGYILKGEQALSKRPILRQIVIYWVEKDPAEFAEALRRVLSTPGVRFHLKQCVLDAIEQAEAADMHLWSVLAGLLQTGDPDLVRSAESLLAASRGWFLLLYEQGSLDRWLRAEEPHVRDRGLRCILQQVRQFPDECAALLMPHAGESAAWDAAILNVTGQALAESRDLFDIFLSLVNRGVVGTKTSPDFWSYLHHLYRRRPAWAAEAVAGYLDRQLEAMALEAFKGEVLDRATHGDDIVTKIAAAFRAASVSSGKYMTQGSRQLSLSSGRLVSLG